MKICPDCKTQNLFDGAQFCRECGAPLDKASSLDQRDNQTPQKSEDFVVIESAQSGAPELIGLESREDASPSSDDGLDIRSSASMLDESAAGSISGVPEKSNRELIGDTGPILPPAPDYDRAEETHSEPQKTAPSPNNNKAEFKKLTKEELADIRKNLYPGGEKSDKSRHENNQPDFPQLAASHSARPNIGDESSEISTSRVEAVRSIEDPAQANGVQRAHKVRGLAYFKGNFIQLMGNSYLHAGDEITVNDKHYLLKPKKLGKKAAIGIFAGGLAILLFIVGLQFINPAVSGKGEVVGMIFDENHQPYLEGARVTIPILNKTTKSNAQGFFHFELIPTGSYELVYELSGGRVGKANTTVSSGQTTLMAFGDIPLTTITSPTRSESFEPRTVAPGVAVVDERRIDQPDSRPKTQPEFGRIQLVSNVADARITLDNKVLGSGNNTYDRIKPGEHNLKVDKPGYSEYAAVIKLDANQTLTVNATLQPTSKESSLSTSVDDHIARGNKAFASGDHQKAIEEYTSALNLQPGSKEAYQKRADAYAKAGSAGKAVEDYIRLGEIYRLGKLNDKAIISFSTALSYEPKNKIALVGRGGARLDNGEYSPALNDFEAALKVDDQFYPALFGGGVSNFKLGNNKQADKYLKNAYKLNQSDPFLYQVHDA